ncbi:MAG: hypothetical protein CM1200mP29_15380 [Verrucomicrobiota bacterium]|nr:MAG: hypothetical protein CM1200mP29_15380 [Verrucomicrobiota bacterium]
MSHTDRNTELAKLLTTMGCPKTKAHEMAVKVGQALQEIWAQTERNISCDETMTHLLNLMRKGLGSQGTA